MLSLDMRRPLISRAITVSIGWTGLFIASGAAQAQQQVACSIADDLAGRAYDRVAEASKKGDRPTAIELKQAFWDIAEYGRNCKKVQKLAKTLTDNGFGKEVTLTKGPIGGPGAPGDPDFRSGGTAALTRQSIGTQSDSGVTGALFGTSAVPDPNAIVTEIIVVPRQGRAGATGSVTGGDAPVGGSISKPTDRLYRVTLRMDDGSTKVITLETKPHFHSGDRVNLTDGVIHR